jgi:hypothetical protein
MLEGRRHLWNSGIFLFSVSAILEAFEAHQPAMFAAVRRAHEVAVPDLAFLRLDPAACSEAPSLSIDYAMMEKAANLSVVPYGGSWSDLGAWDSIARDMGSDAAGSALAGSAHALDSRALFCAPRVRAGPGRHRAEKHRCGLYATRCSSPTSDKSCETRSASSRRRCASVWTSSRREDGGPSPAPSVTECCATLTERGRTPRLSLLVVEPGTVSKMVAHMVAGPPIGLKRLARMTSSGWMWWSQGESNP